MVFSLQAGFTMIGRSRASFFIPLHRLGEILRQVCGIGIVPVSQAAVTDNALAGQAAPSKAAWRDIPKPP
jgi:hypothetical protein